MSPVVLVVVAHPDDETFGTGSVIAAAAAAGARVVVCCATRGEAGEDTSGTTSGPDELARVREGELRAAGEILGTDEIVLLDFADSGMAGDMPAGALAAAPLDDVVARIEAVITAVDPDVVVTLDPDAGDDHRDHVRIGEAAAIAFRVASGNARLYHWVMPNSIIRPWLEEMRAAGLFDAYVPLELGRADDQVTTIIDVAHVAPIRRAAIAEHRTQASPFSVLSPELFTRILAHDYFVRAVPPWDGGEPEDSLFADA